MRRFSNSATGAVAALCLSSAVPAMSATLLVDGSGKLTGATGVVVGGATYDVTFVDGSCVALFGGCDEVSDFDFSTSADALAAATALLDQVFIDGPLGQFDSNPALTMGCTNSVECWAQIPYGFNTFGPRAAHSTNYVPGFWENDQASISSLDPNFSYGQASGFTYARFTAVVSAVPEPSTWAMMLIAFGTMGQTMRRVKRAKFVKIAREA